MRFSRVASILLLLIVASSSVAREPAANEYSIETVTEEFVSSVAAGWATYSICEHIDRLVNTSYVETLIPASELPQRDAISARHLVLQKQGEPVGVDFSLYRLQFASNEAAMGAMKRLSLEKVGTVADGKVLTRYAMRLNGRDIYVVRTQSYLNPAVTAFFESFAK